jgi:hypothetical protein
MLRSILAFLVAPFPAAAFESVVVALWPETAGPALDAHPLSMFVFLCLYFYFFGLVLGLPVWLGLRRIWPGRRAFAGAGLAAGLFPAPFMFALSAPGGLASLFGGLYILMLFGLGGYVAGRIYWRIAMRDGAAAKAMRSAFE